MVLLCPFSAFESGENDSSVYRWVSLSGSYIGFYRERGPKLFERIVEG